MDLSKYIDINHDTGDVAAVLFQSDPTTRDSVVKCVPIVE